MQAESEAESAEQLHEKKQKLEAELEATQQELKSIPGPQQFQSLLASFAQALRLAEEKATQTARAAEAGQVRVTELQSELAAKQRDLDLAAMTQQALKQAPLHVAKQASSETAEQASNETAEEATTDPLQDLEDQLAAKQRELKLLGRRQDVQAVVDAEQSDLDEAIKSQQAQAQAAERAEADRAAQALRLADAQAAERAHAKRLQDLLHDVSEKQRQLKDVTEQAPQVASVAEQAVDTLKEPTQPGCYMRSPSACPKKPMKTKLWRMDSFAVKAGVGKEGCLQRTGMWDKYCGSGDTQMVFVAEQARSE